MPEVLRPLSGHAVFLLLLQLALLLAAARLGAEIVKRLGLPTVVGELCAGIALGPTLFQRIPGGGGGRGVVVVEGIWPNARFDRGIGINALTSADPGWPKGGAVFHDTAVSVRRA